MIKNYFDKLNYKFSVAVFLAVSLFFSEIYGQLPTPTPKPPPEDYTWWYVMLLALFLGLGGAVFWMISSKKAEKSQVKKPAAKTAKQAEADDLNVVIDSYKELEWLRSNRQNIDRKRRKKPTLSENMAHPSKIFNDRANRQAGEEDSTPLPIFSLEQVTPAGHFNPLPIGSDEALLSAIEQTHDEYEEDEAVRELAVRILAAFKKRNSVESLTQVALYDLSSNLRSKAVATLADFNHESVFEPILLACADPTREVRAAAARGISRLSFNRSDAWLRIAETGEKGRMKQSAHAAIEGGFVERIFDRLTHRDEKQVIEAVALINLLIKAEETAPIFAKLSDDKNPEMQNAILHALKIVNDEKILEGLYAFLENRQMSADLKKRIDETIESIGNLVTA